MSAAKPLSACFSKGLVENNDPPTFFAENASQLKNFNVSLGKDAGDPGKPGLQGCSPNHSVRLPCSHYLFSSFNRIALISNKNKCHVYEQCTNTHEDHHLYYSTSFQNPSDGSQCGWQCPTGHCSKSAKKKRLTPRSIFLCNTILGVCSCILLKVLFDLGLTVTFHKPEVSAEVVQTVPAWKGSKHQHAGRFMHHKWNDHPPSNTIARAR